MRFFHIFSRWAIGDRYAIITFCTPHLYYHTHSLPLQYRVWRPSCLFSRTYFPIYVLTYLPPHILTHPQTLCQVITDLPTTTVAPHLPTGLHPMAMRSSHITLPSAAASYRRNGRWRFADRYYMVHSHYPFLL